MPIDEIKKLITDMVSNPDESATLAASLIKQVDDDYTSMESLKKEMIEKDNKIKSLQDTNMKLFLQVTGQESPEQSQEKTPEEKVNDFWAQFTKED